MKHMTNLEKSRFFLLQKYYNIQFLICRDRRTQGDQLEGFEEEEWRYRISGKVNSIELTFKPLSLIVR